ncbi:UNVERIFIED_CONTAM: protein EARLY FLOWERING 3 [Sesamum calycinum]|uniref:Protein EARLY FLOWERING 3 n=1 Tax=Sesamum calycinum TaxID=2727403 RepID=A0AAW2ND54_9LAMI
MIKLLNLPNITRNIVWWMSCAKIAELKARPLQMVSGMPERIMRRTCTPAMDDSLRSFPTHRDGNGLIGTATIKECSIDEDCGPMQGADAGKKQETLDTSAAESTPVVDLTPDDVVGIIGQKLQQRTFAMQIFELHRLIKVQRLVAGSLPVFSENIFNLNVKPSTKFPPTNKQLFAIPVNQSPVVTKRKVDASNPGTHHRAEAEGDFAQQPTPKPSPTPPTNFNAKVAPWCFHPPGNQWRCIGESCLRPYHATVNSHSPVLDLNQTIPFAGAQSAGPDKIKGSLAFDANLPISCKRSCNMVSQSNLVVLDSGENLHGPRPARWQEDALFPTTAAVLCSTDQYNQSLQVIKVVPHDPKSARESAARIFQSIQEERSIT